jgi:hypothetical protein
MCVKSAFVLVRPEAIDVWSMTKVTVSAYLWGSFFPCAAWFEGDLHCLFITR